MGHPDGRIIVVPKRRVNWLRCVSGKFTGFAYLTLFYQTGCVPIPSTECAAFPRLGRDTPRSPAPGQRPSGESSPAGACRSTASESASVPAGSDAANGSRFSPVRHGPEGIARAPEPARWFAQTVRHMGEASRLPLQRGPEPMRAWAQRGGGASPSSESGRQDDPDRPRHRYPHSETDVAETDQRPTQIDSHANFFQEIGSCTNKFGTHFYQIRVLIAGSRRFGLRKMAASISESCL
jgi:hypothetical protein